MVAALLVATLVTMLWAASREVETAFVRTAQERAQDSADQLASLVERLTQQGARVLERAAGNPEVREALRHPSDASHAAARKTLSELFPTGPRRISLWNDAGARLVDLSVPASRGGRTLELTESAAPTKAGVGALRIADNIIQSDMVADVTDESRSRRLGYLVGRSTLNFSPPRVIATLVGVNAEVGLGNQTGDEWTNLSQAAPAPQIDRARRGPTQYRGADGGIRVGAVAPISATPWAISVDFPRSAIVAPARRFVGRMVALGAIVVAVGAGLFALVSVRITKPIRDLSTAAAEIATGDYTRRVATGRHDEVGRLAAAFNAMTTELQSVHEGLEARVTARTRELEQALTALGEAQAQIVRREKLAMLGQLAGGVGHELRNPLGVMTNAVYYLELIQADAPPEVREYLGILRTQIATSARIVSDLLDFARVRPPQHENARVQSLVDEQLARLELPDGIRIERIFAPDLPAVRVDPMQIGHVVLNLLANAVQAMESTGGTLTLAAHCCAEGVQLDVSDTGSGIPEALQGKVFEPLFTTKARGIGLGLAIARSLADSNGSQLRLTSRVGAGTTFSLVMPAALGTEARP